MLQPDMPIEVKHTIGAEYPMMKLTSKYMSPSLILPSNIVPPVPLMASWPLNAPRSVQLPGLVVPLPPDQDQGTEAESLVHSTIMPVPEQVLGVEIPLGFEDELDGDDATATVAELDDEGATASLFATKTELDVGDATGDATGVTETALP